MADAPPALPSGGSLSPLYRDRKAGLVIFGILEILLGCLAWLMIAFLIFSQIMAARMNPDMGQLRNVVPAAICYGSVGVALVILGAGSIRACRWARALSLILAWFWLATGVIVAGTMAFVIPKMLRMGLGGNQAPPPPALMIGLAVGFAILGLFFVLVPGALVLFYQSHHVKSTCEARHPELSWTDACPLPLLGLSLWAAVSALYLVSMPIAFKGVAPFFGVLISGWGGSAIYLALAALWIYAARAVYRRQSAGWWLILASLGLLTASMLITFSRIDLIEFYRQIGYTEAQLQMMQQMNFLSSRTITYYSLLGFCPMLIYLFCVKHLFRSQA